MSFGSGWDIASRLRAAGVHFLVTIVVAAIAASLVFGVWFPSPFASMLGGLKLFFLVVVCDLVLGPLISLVIFNRKKPRSELIRDYVIVGLVQFAALLYGMHSVAMTRPAFVVFAVDRFEVLSAGALLPEDLQQAQEPQWRSASWFGPKWVFAQLPADPQERTDLLFGSVGGGKDLQDYPRYYRDYAQASSEVLSKAHSIDSLLQQHPQSAGLVDKAISEAGQPASALRWLPVRHASGFWTVLVDSQSAQPKAWIDLDPY